MKTVAVIVLLCLCNLPSLGTAIPDPNELVLATVDGEKITMDRLLEEFRARHGGHLAMLAQEQLFRRFLQSSVEERLLLGEALLLELDQDPRIVEHVSNLERERRSRALNAKVRGSVEATDEEMDRIIEQLHTQYRIRWIRSRTRDAAEAARDRIVGGEAFEAVARETSVDRSASQGGDPGVFGWSDGPAELEQQVFGMEPGELSEVFPVGLEYGVVTLLEIIEIEELPEPERLKLRARNLLNQRLQEQAYQDFLEALRSDAGLTVNDDLLTLPTLRSAVEGVGADQELAVMGEHRMTLGDFAGNVDFESWSSLDPELFQRASRLRLMDLIDDTLLATEAIATGAGGAKLDLELAVKRDHLILQMMQAEVMYGDLTPDDDQLKAYYETHPDEFRSSDRCRIRHIVTADRELADELQSRLRAQGDEGFAAAATEWSIDPESGKRGGEVGWIELSAVPASMAESLGALEPGDVSEVIQVKQGFVIVRLMDKETGALRPFTAARDEVEQAWFRAERNRIRETWSSRLRETSEIEIDDAAIAEALRRLETEKALKPAKGKHP